MSADHPATRAIPVIEGALATQPIRRADAVCAWCGIRLRAVPERPVQLAGAWYHRNGCLAAGRLVATGKIPPMTAWQG